MPGSKKIATKSLERLEQIDSAIKVGFIILVLSFLPVLTGHFQTQMLTSEQGYLVLHSIAEVISLFISCRKSLATSRVIRPKRRPNSSAAVKHDSSPELHVGKFPP